MEDDELGVPASPSGSQASPGAAVASPPSVSIPNAWWEEMDTAPRNGLPFFAETADGFRLLAKWQRGFLNGDEEECGSWVAAVEGVHPEDWTDGAYWESNKNECSSDPLVRWIDPNAIAAAVANGCAYKPGTDNFARVYQGARRGALKAFEALASGIEARRAATPESGAVGDESPAPKGDAQNV